MHRTRFRLLAVFVTVGLIFGACGGDDDDGAAGDDAAEQSTSETTTSEAPDDTEAPPETEGEDEDGSESEAATGPQICGNVTSTIGETLTVGIVTGDEVDCAFAEDLLDTYYNDPPSPPEGSGAFLTIGDWECNTSSSLPEGVTTRCVTESGDEIVSFPPTSFDTDVPAGEPGPICSQIDEPTLEQLFPDGNYDEGTCESYIGGENSIDEDG